MVLALVLLSELTQAWLLYLGLVFLFMVMYAPGGISSLVMMNLRVASFGKLGRLTGVYLAFAVLTALIVAGAGAMIEMVYHLQLNEALGPQLKFMGIGLHAKSAASWIGAAAVLAVGIAGFEFVRRRFAVIWGTIQSEIEAEVQRREAAV